MLQHWADQQEKASHMRGTLAKSGVGSMHSTLHLSHQSLLNQLAHAAQPIRRWSENMGMAEVALATTLVICILGVMTLIVSCMSKLSTGGVYTNHPEPEEHVARLRF